MDDSRYLTVLERLDAATRSIPLVTAAPKPNKERGVETPARKVLPGLILRRWRALRRTVRSGGRHPTDGQLHRVRIRAKQLRYAAETAAPVVGEPARRLAAAAEDLQTVLGEHHDSVAAELWLRRQALSGTRRAAFSGGNPGRRGTSAPTEAPSDVAGGVGSAEQPTPPPMVGVGRVGPGGGHRHERTSGGPRPPAAVSIGRRTGRHRPPVPTTEAIPPAMSDAGS